MKKARLLLMTILTVLMMTIVCCAEANYPATLDNGRLVLVDGGMGVGRYADRRSVSVQRYEPPYYQIAINVVSISFSDDYWNKHKTYVGGPYKVGNFRTAVFRYNWNRKLVSHLGYDGIWRNWDINRFHSHAEGNPYVPNTAETAFVAAYNMRFYNNLKGHGGYRVIDEVFYRTLGI